MVTTVTSSSDSNSEIPDQQPMPQVTLKYSVFAYEELVKKFKN